MHQGIYSEQCWSEALISRYEENKIGHVLAPMGTTVLDLEPTLSGERGVRQANSSNFFQEFLQGLQFHDFNQMSYTMFYTSLTKHSDPV